MRKFAIILDGIVENVAIWDGVTPWNPGDEYTIVEVTDIFCDIGYIYNENGFFNPLEN